MRLCMKALPTLPSGWRRTAMQDLSKPQRRLLRRIWQWQCQGECLFPELSAENEDASHEEEKGILVYTDSHEDKYIWLQGDWHPMERILNITCSKSGWVRTPCLGERLLVLLLTQLDYTAREDESEVPYGCCPLSDPTYLLWHMNRPAGMCSLKRTSIWGGEDVYACDTLDTMYVRPFARRQGYSLALLHTLTSELPPGDHLGLSHPVSLSMCKGKQKCTGLQGQEIVRSLRLNGHTANIGTDCGTEVKGIHIRAQIFNQCAVKQLHVCCGNRECKVDPPLNMHMLM
ncbi:hypothetical protein O3P69_000557 [Scylla paramamosain]|uniref:Uncharacterized protein n=1 Tax=Scylla paramamosain TaxID=85552 RepID=A0AAW0UV33_SCYPA